MSVFWCLFLEQYHMLSKSRITNGFGVDYAKESIIERIKTAECITIIFVFVV